MGYVLCGKPHKSRHEWCISRGTPFPPLTSAFNASICWTDKRRFRFCFTCGDILVKMVNNVLKRSILFANALSNTKMNSAKNMNKFTNLH